MPRKLSLPKRLARIPGVHPMTAALVGYLLGDPTLTTPAITSHAVTSDGFFMVGTTKDPFMNLFDEADYCNDKVMGLARHAVQHNVITGDEFIKLRDRANVVFANPHR